jgi:hypothetical protein
VTVLSTPALSAPRVADARRVMAGHWRDDLGFTVPNASAYPWLWLWDSCFHSVIWVALGEPARARRELEAVFAAQTSTGFVPHINYGRQPDHDRSLWGISGASTITQPPLYGHALAVMARAGLDVGHLCGPVTAAFERLFERRATPCGLLQLVHPWENGTDDSPRWGPWQSDPFDRRAWWETKGHLVEALELDGREAIGSDRFAVCAAGFNALVAFGAAEAAEVTGDSALASAARRLAATLDRVSWHDTLGTWVDVAPDGTPTSAVRTGDGLLGALCTPEGGRARRVLDSLTDPDQYGTPFGPAGVHPAEPSYHPDGYWRGGAWTPLDYLWRTAADRRGLPDHAAALDRSLVTGAFASELSEYRHPQTGSGLGARPQSWTCLAVVPRHVASPISQAATGPTEP